MGINNTSKPTVPPGQTSPEVPGQTQTATADPTPTAITLQVPGHHATPTPTPKPTVQPTAPPVPGSSIASHPVLAFYYSWYNSSTWSASTMPDLPTVKYNSSDDATIDRQLSWASSAGITGFINSWWGPGDQTDKNFAKVLAHSASLESRTGYDFTSSIYLECDAPAFGSIDNFVSALRYIKNTYSNDPHFFHWQGKPVIFFWKALDQGRTLSDWASIRDQVDPDNQMIWSVEGVDISMLSVFDGIHLFSGGYWGLQSNSMAAVDEGFRAKVDAYNSAHGTHKIWAAGVIPGYNDTHVPGRTGAYIVPRDNGATYAESWNGAIASHPDWVTITSFNEWFEGAMIEPSVTYGTQYINLTRQFSGQWRNS
ncbi:glycoside hydrolase family 99-like domain-containing protein [Ktedonosporobacter rubrisoli]|uniref:glycoside hydrolase family 99-like domain-containing protein n=1 Tax=Ktedonosporobacter rubrisoli TaxID=2509675 RepID=UPI0013EE8998|nr:glycoside hydrolase family 99-like domain-containing protein [Ktedonosporobacter rubrisoli]